MPPGNSAIIKRLQATEHADTLNSRQLTKKHGIFCSQTFLSTAINTHPGSFARSRICLFVCLVELLLAFLVLGNPELRLHQTNRKTTAHVSRLLQANLFLSPQTRLRD
ncbi:hypothetical protein LY78DRAFT_93504 [Colletotrichum sublineola]|nr:hypothetical protein LY78DRAFT_93504 [Colletotrichum sublineola]